MAESKPSPFHRTIDRYHLPEPEWEFPNAKIKTYAVDSTPDFPPMKEAPKGSPNILLVLLDDVGFRVAERQRRAGAHADGRAAGEEGPVLQPVPHHCAVFADARGAADRTESPLRGHRRDPGNGDGIPGLLRHHPEKLRHVRGAAQAGRLHLLVVWQEPQRAGQPDQCRRPVRQLADQPGLRLLLRLHRRRDGPVLSIADPQYRVRSSRRSAPKTAIS